MYFNNHVTHTHTHVRGWIFIWPCTVPEFIPQLKTSRLCTLLSAVVFDDKLDGFSCCHINNFADPFSFRWFRCTGLCLNYGIMTNILIQYYAYYHWIIKLFTTDKERSVRINATGAKEHKTPLLTAGPVYGGHIQAWYFQSHTILRSSNGARLILSNPRNHTLKLTRSLF